MTIELVTAINKIYLLLCFCKKQLCGVDTSCNYGANFKEGASNRLNLPSAKRDSEETKLFNGYVV